jgi:mannose-6-phosphate isomerase-like protein (cupin superfamily)
MNNLVKIAHGVDTAPLLLEIARQPKLWNRHTVRKTAPETPHASMDDIWLRYNDEKPFKESGDWSKFNDPHDAIFYPEWFALPSVRPIVYNLMARVQATRLGGVMITRIPAGGRIEPHADDGWHATYYNTKLYVVLQSNPQCVNRVEDEKVSMAPGEVWYFDNLKEHEVVNDGPDDRITLIVCLRCER